MRIGYSTICLPSLSSNHMKFKHIVVGGLMRRYAVVDRSVPPIFPSPSAKSLRSLRQSMTMVRFAPPSHEYGHDE